jgi:hypothetical protein
VLIVLRNDSIGEQEEKVSYKDLCSTCWASCQENCGVKQSGFPCHFSTRKQLWNFCSRPLSLHLKITEPTQNRWQEGVSQVQPTVTETPPGNQDNTE